MTTELRAPEQYVADTGPMRPRTRCVLSWIVLAVYVVLRVGGYSLAGKLDSVTRDSQADYLPASDQSTKVVQAEAGLPRGKDGLLVVVYGRPSCIQVGDREVDTLGYAELAERFDLSQVGEDRVDARA